MRSVTVREARVEISKLLDAVEHGEEIVILRRGRPVARLVRATVRTPFPDRANFRASIRAARIGTAEVARALREEERA